MNNEQYKCCICLKDCVGWGNNPEPVYNCGRCCDECNQSAVLPARIQLMFQQPPPPTREELRQRLRQNIRNKRK